MITFKILWVIDAIAALVILYFLFVGFADGTVGERNIGAWLGLVVISGTVLTGGIWLRSNNHPVLAYLVLAVLAVPAIFYGLFILIATCSGAKWN